MTGWGTWWCSAILVAFAILFGGASNRAHGDDGRADDGWRRTAQGWERMESWTAPQSTALYGYRFDTNDYPARSRSTHRCAPGRIPGAATAGRRCGAAPASPGQAH